MDPNIITLINTFAVENARLKEDVKTAKAELQLWKEGAQEMCDGIRQSWITQETVLQQFCKRVGIEWRDDPKAASLRQRPIVSVDEKHGLADSPQNSISGGNYDLANSSRTSNSFDGNNRVANSPQTSTTFADKLSGYLKDPPRIPSTSSSMKWKPRQDGAIDWMKDGNSGVELVYDSDPIASEEEYPRWEYPRLDEAELDFVEAGGRSKSPKQSDVAESAIESDEDSHDDDFDANVLELPSADGDVEIRENTPNNPESASVSKGTKGSSVGSAVRRKMRDPSPEEGRSDGDLALAPYELEEDDEDEPINHSLPLKDFVNRLPRGRLIVYILHQANAGIKTPLKLQEISAKLKEHLDVDYNAAQVRKAASAYMLKKGEKSPIVRAEKGLYALKSEYLGDQLFARKGFGNLGVLARKQKGVPADRISSSLPASSTPQHQAAPQSTSETSIEVATAPRPASPPGTAAPRGGRSPAPSKVDLPKIPNHRATKRQNHSTPGSELNPNVKSGSYRADGQFETPHPERQSHWASKRKPRESSSRAHS
ncbi:hypothetical protein HK097_008039 [Rhizophlyctis rosea]|uniref:Uncharacterized protein n=1 Tax=Rhizophlyctis rosea TaxID=64517 RepID=A0AAD5X4G4_9FUNG|nr:hypothetical protein HK097_008039 [Rhizophlyctis rosea]